MTGISDLGTLLAGLRPEPDPVRYGFVTGPDASLAPHAGSALMRFVEAEGTTLILPFDTAEAAGLEPVFPCRRITLAVHSSLEAVGFMARIAATLAAEGIGCNPVAGYFHDHVFVPEDRLGDALAALKALARASGREFD
ncbi:ACT domain-containing protein [uncultured Maricaulis sp.]|uniref:ACT domain-containing protein n=1 Tax=uncultured Maricaulis sp. TaxID=174710 RepID=UPI002614F273|nr:ACT domain-containing protein [uncultured Maricaulis sp.]